MGRIEDAAEALKQQQLTVESEAERRRREAEEDLAEFVQIMRRKGVPPERTYQRAIEYRGVHSRTSHPTAIVSFTESPVAGWIIKFSFRGEHDHHEWHGTLVTADLALWRFRAFKRHSPTGRAVEYPVLQPGQMAVSKVFPGGAAADLVVTADEPLPDHLREYETGALAKMARTYLDSLN